DKVQRNFSKHVERMFQAGFYEGGPHPTTPALRLKDQEIDGIDAEVMYGILGIGLRMQDRELIQTVYEIYNDWAADFCKSNPHRFVGLACIPSHDPAAAAAELRRAARLGLKGADFAVSTAAYPSGMAPGIRSGRRRRNAACRSRSIRPAIPRASPP